MDGQDFSGFIIEADAAATPRELWDASGRLFASAGVRRFSAHHYLGTDVREPFAIFAEGFPADWVDAYVGDRLSRVDPIPVHALSANTPFAWSAASGFDDLSEAETQYLARLRAAELGDGLAVPVFGPDRRNGYIGLGFGAGPAPELSTEQVRTLQAACQIAHLRYCSLVPAEAPDDTGLSAREREVLHWMVKGKSNGVIADILGCSPHTVDTHARRIFRKLGVADRISAAVQAVGRGLAAP